jgi:glycopeptide antibiotics resistance protein
MILWLTLAKILHNRKELKLINMIALSVSVIIILCATIFFRHFGERAINLMPFKYFIENNFGDEECRITLFNIILFIPLGLFIPFLLSDKIKNKFWTTVFIAFVFSLAIECLQYIFALGVAETDDLICNVFGAMIGTIPYFIIKLINKIKASRM